MLTFCLLAIPILNGGVNIVQSGTGFAINSQTASGTVTQYEFYRSTSSGVLSSKIVASAGNSYQDNGLTNGVTYYYQIKACNSSGCATSGQDRGTYRR